jgi:hypothetical protein
MLCDTLLHTKVGSSLVITQCMWQQHVDASTLVWGRAGAPLLLHFRNPP